MWNLILHFLTFAGGMASGVMLMCLMQVGKENHSPNQAKGLLIDKAIDKPFLSYKPFCIPSVIGSIKQYYLITHFIIFCISHMMKMSGGGTMRNK